MKLQTLPQHLIRFFRNYISTRSSGKRHTWGPRVSNLAEYIVNHSPALVATYQWKSMVEKAWTDLENISPEKWIEIRYADLIHDPSHEALRIASFCELDDADALVEHAHGMIKTDFRFDKFVLPSNVEWVEIQTMINETKKRLDERHPEGRPDRRPRHAPHARRCLVTLKNREEVRESYAQASSQYDSMRLENPKGRLVSEHDIKVFMSLFPKRQDGLRIVEIGAGTGRFTIPVLQHGFSITATDINESLLEGLTNKLEQESLDKSCTIEISDVFNLHYDDNSIDLIFSIHVIPRFDNLKDQRDAIREIGRVLKPGGMFIFNYNNRSSFWGWFYDGFTTRPREMKDILRNADLIIEKQRGKWLINRSLVNRLPLPLARFLALLDRPLWHFWPSRAWDVFVLARKPMNTDECSHE